MGFPLGSPCGKSGPAPLYPHHWVYLKGPKPPFLTILSKWTVFESNEPTPGFNRLPLPVGQLSILVPPAHASRNRIAHRSARLRSPEPNRLSFRPLARLGTGSPQRDLNPYHQIESLATFPC